MPHAIHHPMTSAQIARTMHNHMKHTPIYASRFMEDGRAFLDVVKFYAANDPVHLQNILPSVLEVKRFKEKKTHII